MKSKNTPTAPLDTSLVRVLSLTCVALAIIAFRQQLPSVPAQPVEQPSATARASVSLRHDSAPVPDGPAKAATAKTPGTLQDDLALIASAPMSEDAFAAACRLADQGDKALPALTEALGNARNAEHARLLASALARIGTGDAVDAIWHAALGQPDPKMRDATLEACDTLTNPEGISLLASALASTSDPAFVQAATRTLGRAATVDAVDFLAELYAEQPGLIEQRSQLVTAMRLIANPSAIPALSDLARRTDMPEMATAAASSLAKMGNATSALALRDAYEALPAGHVTADALRQSLLDAFINLNLTADNAPLMAFFAEQSPSAEWRAASQALLARSGSLAGSSEARSPVTEEAHYRVVEKNPVAN